jgi:hypothetical protein
MMMRKRRIAIGIPTIPKTVCPAHESAKTEKGSRKNIVNR